MKKKPTYYITTPIYYPSGKWHIGHCYTTVCCDAMARYKRMSGYDVFYLTGTDEHGQKIEKRAQEAGTTPINFVDALVDDIKRLWGVLDISYDKFIRTTDDYHVEAVQKIFTRLYESGDIYKSNYSGKYCTPCEAFWTDTQVKDGKCPDCGREVVTTQEECYFFRLSKYADRVRKLLAERKFLEPESRVNEMINNFIDAGLEDLAVSRTSFKWGVPVPFDTKHVIYVWIDALSNYITALGYGSDDDSLYKKFWPADLHMMAKEIVRFHAIIWPAILMALGEPLPKREYGHGWILFGGDKMSKSKGNVVDPFVLTERYGIDSVRYYLLRDITFGADSNYSSEIFLTRINTDLANDLGNLTKRTLAMARQYFNGKVTIGAPTEFDDEFIAKINAVRDGVNERIDKLAISRALEFIFDVIGSANKYIDNTKPWVLFKEGKTSELQTVLYNLLESIRVCTNMLVPFLTQTPAKIYGALGLKLPSNFNNAVYGKVKSYKTTETETLFPRYDIKKELSELMEIEENDAAKTGGAKADAASENSKISKNNTDNGKDNVVKGGSNTAVSNAVASETDTLPMITIDEFFKTSLKVGEVMTAERVPKSEKLLKLSVSLGGELRTVVSGIAKSYTPEELIGKKIVLVANLKPAKLCGIESQGMILCASDAEGKPVIITPEKLVASGVEVG